MSKTDLFGKPLAPTPEFRLNKWQKRQAAMLYHFASINYLKGLKKLLDDFVNGVDVTLDHAAQQNRDEALADVRWGVRDTVANFSTYGFPALRDFQKSVNKQIAEIASDCYHGTGMNQCARVLGELSLGWSTPDEQQRFEAGMKVLESYAGWIDTTMMHGWNDGIAAVAWQEFGDKLMPLPRFKVHTYVTGESGRLPPRTGVYVPIDDPYGTLQFAWTGNADGQLADMQTFNELGREAVRMVGRDELWRGRDRRLLEIATRPANIEGFKQLNWFNDPAFAEDPSMAMAYVSENGSTARASKWYFVERIEGESDRDDGKPEGEVGVLRAQQRLRCEAGETCPREGFWFTPAQANSRRRFKQGEVMPAVSGSYGATIWQWDDRQD